MADSNSDIKCPNCKEAVKSTTDHFEEEYGAQTWTCKRKKRVRINKDVEQYHFDIMEKWEIVIHLNGNDCKTITSNGLGTLSELRIEQVNSIN